jgi:hypothetical protein
MSQDETTAPENPDEPIPQNPGATPGEGEPGTQVAPPGEPPTADPYSDAAAD